MAYRNQAFFGLTAPAPIGAGDTWRAALGRLWRLVKWTLFSNQDGE
jgi:hypothetical protein